MSMRGFTRRWLQSMNSRREQYRTSRSGISWSSQRLDGRSGSWL